MLNRGSDAFTLVESNHTPNKLTLNVRNLTINLRVYFDFGCDTRCSIEAVAWTGNPRSLAQCQPQRPIRTGVRPKLRPDTGVIGFLSLAILVVGIGLLFLGSLSR